MSCDSDASMTDNHTTGDDLRCSLQITSIWHTHVDNPAATNISRLSTTTNVLGYGTEVYLNAVKWGRTMQEERNEAIAEAHYWSTSPGRLAHGPELCAWYTVH